MHNYDFRHDDEQAVMREIGPLMPNIICESIHDGFHKYALSRKKDEGSFTEYTDCTRANMLYDRVASSAKALIDAARAENDNLHWKTTANKRATDILLDTRFAFRVKRSKRNRGNLTTGVRTLRQKWIKPDDLQLRIGQLYMPFPSNTIDVPDQDRMWITVAFDLDAAEEGVSKVRIGYELNRRFLWVTELLPPTQDVLATLPTSIVTMIIEMRQRRSA